MNIQVTLQTKIIMLNDKLKHYKATLKNKDLEKLIFHFLTKLSEHKNVSVSLMLSGNIAGFLNGKIQESDPKSKIHYYNVLFEVDMDHNVTFHQFKNNS